MHDTWRWFMVSAATWLVIVCTSPHIARSDYGPSPQRLVEARQLLGVLDAVIDHHIAPPTRQEMLLRGCRAISPQDNFAAQAELSRRVSDLQSRDETAKFLAALLPKSEQPGFEHIRRKFIAGALTAVVGGAHYSPAKDYAVEQQLRENRYVGIGIALSMKNGRPAMAKVVPGGPAHRAGGKDGDLMISIAGRDAKAMPLDEIIKVLRGQAGKPVDIVVRQPTSQQERTLKIIRGEVPFGSVEGARRDANDDWVYAANESQTVAYLKLTAVRGSSARELKQAAQQLHGAGFKALALDLRETSLQGDLRHAVMFADELLGAAPLGSVTVGGKTEAFASSPDQLFASWPIAVLVGPGTRGQAEWIAAALQDNRRATIFGQRTAGWGFVESSIALENGDAITLHSGSFNRANCQSLVSRGGGFGVTSLNGTLSVSPPGDSLSRRQPPRGWRGIQPDQTVDNATVVRRAVDFLDARLKDSAAAE